MSENIEINSIINVNFGTNVVSGKVVNIKREKSNDLIIAEFSKGFENVADKRFTDVNIEKTVDKSYELFVSSILYENGKYYVFTIDSFNNIKKVKVSVKFTDNINNKVYIDVNNSYIGSFSNVLRNSQRIKRKWDFRIMNANIDFILNEVSSVCSVCNRKIKMNFSFLTVSKTKS